LTDDINLSVIILARPAAAMIISAFFHTSGKLFFWYGTPSQSHFVKAQHGTVSRLPDAPDNNHFS
jgi:hypothetical protein